MDIIKWNEYELSEKPAIELLQQLGYTYIHGKDLSPQTNPNERESLRNVLLKTRFISKLKEFNPWISDRNIKQVIRMMTIPDKPSVLEFNKVIWEYLTKPNTLSVEQDLQDGRGRRNHTVQVIDWYNPEKNEFLCSNQFKVNASRGNRIPDIVIFINGLPLVVIECKSPIIHQPLTQAITQVKQYQEIIPKLFYYNQIIIITAAQSARYGVIGADYANYSEWKDPYPITIDKLSDIITKTGRKTTEPTPQDILLYGMCEPHNLLDIIHNFVVFEKAKCGMIKKIPRYQQFRAVNKTLERIFEDGERGGTIWHTQGSGKSLTMLFTAIKLRRESRLENPLLVFVSDRIDLVEQLNGTFENCGFANVKVPDNMKHLQQLIKTGQGVTIFTTSQKFRETTNHKQDEEDNETDEQIQSSYPILNIDENIFVLVDEAHRSQYKKNAMRMRKSMPNAFYIAYTGTPLARTEKEEKIAVGKGKTVRKFGSFIDVYDIRQSVEDGATVQIYYENRLPELQIEGNSIDKIFDRVFAEKTPEEREAIQKKYANKKAILSAEERIKKVALDIIEHYESTIKPNNFKAQVVVNSRELAIRYKKYLDLYNGPESVIIMSENLHLDVELKKEGIEFLTKKKDQRIAIDRFKDPNSSLKFLIVCDMLITGFDAPIEQVIYLDKSLREHNLLQAIARVNRTFEHKTHGLIVDYYGISSNLEEALEIFDTVEVEGVMKDIKGELPRLDQFHRKVMSYLKNLDKTDLEGIVLALLPEDKRANFYSDFKNFSQTLDMVLPDPRAEPYLDDLKLLERIIAALRVRTRDEGLNIAGCGGKVKQLIDEHIRSLGITQLVDPVPILSPKFQETLDSMKSPAAKASEMEHAIKHEIAVKVDEDPIFYSSLKERLEEIIEMYRQNRIDLAEQIKHMQALVDEIKEKPRVAEDMGLRPKELAFYNLLVEDLKNLGISDEREIVGFTIGILEVLEEFTTLVDWDRKRDVVRRLRMKCKQLFPSDMDFARKQTLAQEIVNLAKVHYS